MSVIIRYEDLEAAAGHLAAERQELESKLTSIGLYIENLTQNGFQTTSSSAALRDSFMSYIAQARQTVSTLDDYRNHLQRVLADYKSLDVPTI